MDDMGTPSNNHPAFKALKDRGADKARVIDLNVYRVTKDLLGKGERRAPKFDSPALTKHEDEAIDLGNSGK
jgi:hypothetical protein